MRLHLVTIGQLAVTGAIITVHLAHGIDQPAVPPISSRSRIDLPPWNTPSRP
jgi:hypothetical protein